MNLCLLVIMVMICMKKCHSIGHSCFASLTSTKCPLFLIMMSAIAALSDASAHLNLLASTKNCLLQHLLLWLLRMSIVVLSVPPLTMVPMNVPFGVGTRGVAPPREPVSPPKNALTPMKYALSSKMVPVASRSAQESMLACSAKATQGPCFAPPVPQRQVGQLAFLNVPYWAHNLPLVYEPSKAAVILEMLHQGVRIGRSAATDPCVSPNWPSAVEHRVKVGEVIQNDLELGRLHGPFRDLPYKACIVSPLGAFLKKNSDKVRVIHDLSYPAVGSVNSLIDPTQFSLKYSSVEDAVEICNRYPDASPFLAKLDLQDAFKMIAIHPDDWHLMGFTWPDPAGRNQYFFSRVLSFGLRSAPALFDIFASALTNFMIYSGVTHHIVRYVDDFLIVAPTYASCKANLDLMLQVCRLAGFPVQPSKVTDPGTMVKFLGITINSVERTLSIDPERLQEVKSLTASCLSTRSITKRQLLSLIGKLAFAARVVFTGRAFLGRLIEASKSTPYLHYSIRLDPAARADLQWWHDCVESHNGVAMFHPPWDEATTLHVFTDASNTAVAGYFHPDWFATTFSGSMAGAASMSINWRELYAVLTALATWGPRLSGRNVKFHIDNQSVVAALTKLYSPVPTFMALIRDWASLIVRYSVNPLPIYIPTGDNVDADDLSRMRINSFLERQPQASATSTWPTLIKFS